MEIIFIVSVTLASLLVQYIMYCEIRKANARLEISLKNQTELDEALAGDLEGIEKALVLLSEKVQVLPDTIKDDVNRTLLTFRETLEATKPIKPNNWDSFREAFKGPTRVEINERN